MISRSVEADAAVRPSVSVFLPAKNEAAPLQDLLPRLRAALPGAELVVVDDGSTDRTAEVAANQRATVVHHLQHGQRSAIEAGARAVNGHVLLFMDADSQHDPADIPRLLSRLGEGYDLVLGCRTGASSVGSGDEQCSVDADADTRIQFATDRSAHDDAIHDVLAAGPRRVPAQPAPLQPSPGCVEGFR